MASRRITAAAVAAMQPDDVLWDTEVRGFGVRQRAASAVYLLKTRISGRQRILTIGRNGRGAWGPESARREAIRLLGLIRDGHDPAGERDATQVAPTFATLAARYMDEFATSRHKPRTLEEEHRLLRLHLLPRLGTVRVRDIGRADAARLHNALRTIPVSANRSLALLSTILGWAERIGERPDGSNPCRHVAKFPERARERLLSAAELARLGTALEESLEDWRAIAGIRLLLFTGARRSEILGLRWADIDMAKGVARLPDSKTGPKNLYMPPGALAVLGTLPRLSEHVLPGDRAGAAFVGIAKPWQRIRRAAGLPELRLHDLRHAFASVAVAGGDSLLVVGKLLGHTQAATTQRYAHLAPDPLRAVANRVGDRIGEMLSGTTVDVPVPMEHRGRK
jgi:integrase